MPGETLRTLSSADVALVQGVLDRMRRLPPGGGGGGGQGGGDDYFTPEVYVCRAPAGGVPARLGADPGAAECNIYRITDAAGALSLEQVPTLTLPVYNLGVESLTPDSFFIAARDKYGSWLAVEPAGSAAGGGTATGSAADINYFRHAPCPYQPGWQARWYTADTGRCPAIAALAVGAGLPALGALPFISPRGGRVGHIAVYLEVAGGAGDTCRVGIYRAPSASDLAPGVLLFGSGPLDASQAGRVEAACDLALEAGVLYYLAASLPGTGRFRCLDAGDLFPVWGLGEDFSVASFAAAVGLWAFAAAADPLPAAFPADALPFTPGDRVPLVAVRYACEPAGSGSGSGGGACCPPGVSLPAGLVVTLLSQDSLNSCIGGLSIPVTLHPEGGPTWAPTADQSWYGGVNSNPCGGSQPFQASFSCDGTFWILVLHCGSEDGAAGSSATSMIPVDTPGATCDPPNFTFSLNFPGSNPCGLASTTIKAVVTKP